MEDVLYKEIKIVGQRDNIKLKIDAAKIPSLFSYNEYKEFDTYRIEYITTFKNKQVRASGIIYLPANNPNSLSIVSYQHETLLFKKEAPTIAIHNLIPEIIASQGFIVLVQDYLGYGSTDNLTHPYYDKFHSASCGNDFIKAALSFLNKRKLEINKKLFLMGFSEGGYVTLSMQQSLELQPLRDLELTAVAACAGGYDLIHLLKSLIIPEGGNVKTPYIIFLLIAYNSMYLGNKNLSHYFNKKYASKISEVFNGNYTEEVIQSIIPNDLELLFNLKFYKNLIGNGELKLKEALFLNTLSHHKPLTPLKLYHSLTDEVMPFKNSETTYNNFVQNNSKVVSLITIQGENHHNSSFSMVGPTIEWFQELERNRTIN